MKKDERKKQFKKRCKFLRDIENFSKENSLKIFWVSAKDDTNITEMFDYV